jgi:hypothetical protein
MALFFPSLCAFVAANLRFDVVIFFKNIPVLGHILEVKSKGIGPASSLLSPLFIKTRKSFIV